MNEELRQASEVARDPLSVSTATYLWLAFVSFLGGAVRVIREVNLGGKTWWQITRIFLAEMLTSLFVGIVTFFLCESSGFQPFHTAAMVSIAAFMGGKTLAIIEAIYKARIHPAPKE